MFPRPKKIPRPISRPGNPSLRPAPPTPPLRSAPPIPPPPPGAPAVIPPPAPATRPRLSVQGRRVVGL
ncbi:hypothetical protein D9753_09055 [Streptomyces dangxiongensis]|uniref:Uncharacterized protein n=1 Tax=Streptomyces dangxiongensis TaxID=1442032 RepID=A0A3G2J9S3_9ACTN|nr:hypothetical protein D9753_09055 [Streptomyces dangxiongensis]